MGFIFVTMSLNLSSERRIKDNLSSRRLTLGKSLSKAIQI